MKPPLEGEECGMAIGAAFRVAVASVLLLAAAACGDDDGSSSSAAGAAQGLCDSLESLDSTVEEITSADVDSETTIGDVQDALDQVQSDLQDVQTSGADLTSTLKVALQSAFNSLEDKLQDLPNDETLADAGSSVEEGLQQLDTAWTNALDSLNCSSS